MVLFVQFQTFPQKLPYAQHIFLKKSTKKMPDWTKKALFKGGFGQVDPNFLELPCSDKKARILGPNFL